MFPALVRGSTPARFSSQTLLSQSPRFMAEGDGARQHHEHDGVVQGAPSHHRAQGVPLIHSGIPLSLLLPKILKKFRIHHGFDTLT